MEKQLPVLQVQFLGNEKISYGDVPVLQGRNGIPKAMKLLLIMLYHWKDGIPRSKLLDALYGREELANAGNNLRVTLHRLKKQLLDAGLPDFEYISTKKGIYYWNSPMKIVVDTDVFRDLIAKAEEETDEDCKIELLRQALDLYKGEFLQKMSGEEWAVIEGMQYKRLYTEALNQIVVLLMARREFTEVLKYVEPACELYPFDDWQAVKIDCYIAMNHYKEAFKEYEDTAKMLVEELGVAPSERMMSRFKEMSSHISNRPQNILEIKGGLKEDDLESGAFFCTVPSFRDLYRSVRRGMERSGQSVFLLVCTLTDSLGRPMENSKKLDEMSEGLFYAIKGSLRRGDSFTKYNPSQYLAILVGTNEENCQIVIDRISKNYANIHKSWAGHLQCSVSSLYDME